MSLITSIYLYWAKCFPGKAFELLATLRIQLQIANTWNKYFLRKESFGQRPCKIARRQIIFCVCSWLHCSNVYLVFQNEKGELTTLTTKHGLLASWTTRKVCFLTTNLLKYKSENLFSEPRFEGHHSHLPSYTEDLFSYHNSYHRRPKREMWLLPSSGYKDAIYKGLYGNFTDLL